MRTISFVLFFLAINDVLACGKVTDPAHDCWNPDRKYETPSLLRFYALSDLIEDALFENKADLALSLSNEYLKLADEYKKNWNYGNAIYDANTAKGIVELRRGNYAKSADYLVIASKSPGSPQLDSFGPDLRLANVLLKHGEKDKVVEYMRGIKIFWADNSDSIDRLISKIISGEKVQIDEYSILNERANK